MVMIHKGQKPDKFNKVNDVLFRILGNMEDDGVEDFCFYQTLLEFISDTCHESISLDKLNDGKYHLHTCSMEEVFECHEELPKAIGRLAISIIERANKEESYGC